MPIAIQDVENRLIYQESSGTLAERVDFAWSVYSSNGLADLNKEQLKKDALMFLTYAFDIRDPQDVNGQLITLMAERDKYKADNPEYIPGKSSTRIPFNPATVIPTASSFDLKPTLTKKELQAKKEELSAIVTKYEQENKSFSVKNGKSESSGRFAETVSHFKEQLQVLRSADHPADDVLESEIGRAHV